MRRRGEITVFLSLTVVCVLSLLLALWESARTAGARLYLRMAADSAADSLMSQYNRNLWDMYRLLFLECADPEAIGESYETYLNYYLEQENFYPMRAGEVKTVKTIHMRDDEGKPLEDAICSYMKYGIFDWTDERNMAGNLLNDAGKAGNLRDLITICRQAGKETIRLEKARKQAVESLRAQKQAWERAKEAAEDERENRFRSEAVKLKKEMARFPGYVRGYETEFERMREQRKNMGAQAAGKKDGGNNADKNGGFGNMDGDGGISAYREQEVLAYSQVEEAAKACLGELKAAQETMEGSRTSLENALEDLEKREEEEEDDEEEEEEIDWDLVRDDWDGVEIPEIASSGEVDEEKANALERLERLFDQDLLSMVLPRGAKVSMQSVRLLPPQDRGGPETLQLDVDVFLIHRYIRQFFGNYESSRSGETLGWKNALSYEQEYLLCGSSSDRQNLKKTAEQLLALRGAMNLFYLLSDSEKRAEADALALAVAGAAGLAPLQTVVSFFILSLWAFGESIADLRALFSGGGVPAWKDAASWKLGLSELLKMQFPDAGGGEDEGYHYEDYLNVLLFLTGRRERNLRMMDLIEWNVRGRQKDFDTRECISLAGIQAEITQRHVFSQKYEYKTSIYAEKSY